VLNVVYAECLYRVSLCWMSWRPLNMTPGGSASRATSFLAKSKFCSTITLILEFKTITFDREPVCGLMKRHISCVLLMIRHIYWGQVDEMTLHHFFSFLFHWKKLDTFSIKMHLIKKTLLDGNLKISVTKVFYTYLTFCRNKLVHFTLANISKPV